MFELVESETTLGAIEIEQIPDSYLKSSRIKHSQDHAPVSGDSDYIRFQQLLHALMYIETPAGYRMQTDDSRMKVSFVTRAVTGDRLELNLSVLENSFRAQFPDFPIHRTLLYQTPPSWTHLSVALVSGIPRPDPLPLDAFAEVMLRYEGSSIYQAMVESRKPSFINRSIAQRKFESKTSRAQTERTEKGLWGSQVVRHKVDSTALEDARRLGRIVKKMNASQLLRAHVIIAFWGADKANGIIRDAVAALVAAVSDITKYDRLRIEFQHGRRAAESLSKAFLLEGVGRHTDMLPEEAVPYFMVPKVDLGIAVGRPASFTASTTETTPQCGSEDKPPVAFKQGYIALGHPYRMATVDSRRTQFLRLEDLRHHVAIFGKTGMGKSTTKNRIVIDAWKNGIPSLLIEPVKTDARALMGAIDELRVFTVGQEGVAPFRLNPFLIETGVDVGLHIDLLNACFAAAWPLYGILVSHMRRVINKVYSDNGWDRVRNTHGAPITLEMFRDTAERYCEEELEYGSQLTQDFRGAILARVEDMCEPSRAAILNPEENLPMNELLRCPTVIELRNIADPDFRALLISLLLVKVYEYVNMLGRSGRLRLLLVIDEAHQLMEELPKTADAGDGITSRRHAIDQLVNTAAEARSPGLGLVLAEQIPTRLARNALKNCHTKIVHKLTSPDDVQLMALETGCSERQAEHMTVLRKGEAIVSDMECAVPYDIQVLYDGVQFDRMEDNWTDDEVHDKMRQFYAERPRYAETPKLSQPSPSAFEPAIPDEGSESVLKLEIRQLVETDVFGKDYMSAVERTRVDNDCDDIETVLGHYAVYFAPEGTPPEQVVQMIYVEASTKLCPSPRPLRPETIRRAIANTIRGPER